MLPLNTAKSLPPASLDSLVPAVVKQLTFINVIVTLDQPLS
jgi:hypothetical protein